MEKFIDELTWRGLLASHTDADALQAHLEAGPITFYCGFDPTAPSLHVGHLLQLQLMARLQRRGHRPLVLVGGATGLIGDPKPTAERSMLAEATVADWTAQVRAQVEPFFSFDGPSGAILVNNLDWIGPMGVLEFLRDVGKHFSINRMLDREAVRRRLASESGISFTEFSYVLLQSRDYLELSQRHGCTLQIGGSDQWGNITAGVDLIRRVTGARVHALTTPLITKADGTKFGKSESGTVWLSPELTSPYEFHQFWLNADDRDVISFLKTMTFLDQDEIDALRVATETRPGARAAQRRLADELTRQVHGEAELARVTAAAAALFGRGSLADCDSRTLEAIAKTIPNAELAGEGPWPVVDVLVSTGLVATKAAARRAINEGGASLNNQRITDVEQSVTRADLVHGRYALIRRGRRNAAMAIA